MISLRFKRLKIRKSSIKISRRIIQIIAFLIINYFILEALLPINLISLEGIFKVLPIQNSPRNPFSSGAGILEYIFFSMAKGVFPFFLLAVLILVLLFSNRIFCGWICPIGSIQDLCAAIPTKRRKVKINMHKKILNLKYVIIIFIVIIIFPVGILKNTNYSYFIEITLNTPVGAFAEQPIGFFSLSEFIFVFFPDLIKNVFLPAQFGALDFGGYVILIISSLLIILSVWYPRIYCRYICPFAAVSSAVTEYSLLKLARNPVRCVGRSECGICEDVCPKQIRILDEPFDFFTGKGECNFCLECKEKCPYNAVLIKFGNV